MVMNTIIITSVCLLFSCHGRRIQSSMDLIQDELLADKLFASLAQVGSRNSRYRMPTSGLRMSDQANRHRKKDDTVERNILASTDQLDSEEKWTSQLSNTLETVTSGTGLESIFKLRGGYLGSVASRAAELVGKGPSAKYKVCVVGGAGGIGQPLSLSLAQHPLVKELSIVDLNIAAVPVPGVAADLSHVEGPTKVTSTTLELGKDKTIEKAGDSLSGCHVVLVPAGVPRKPGQDRKDLMKINADIAKGTVEACAKHCPEAVIGLIVNPVNSIVPAMAELWEKAGLNPLNVVGISSLDSVRSNKFVQDRMGKASDVPVIGGHAGKTILPLFSQDRVAKRIPEDEISDLDERMQNAGTEVVKEKAGKGSATLSMAYAAARWAGAVLKGLDGKSATECTYVKSSVVPELPYFASKVVFGRNGVKEVLPIGKMSEHEKERLDELIPILKEDIDMGLEYAAENEFEK